MRRPAMVVLGGLLFAATAQADDNRRGGNCWNAQDRLYKLPYITGLFDGMGLGKDFIVWSLMKSKDPCAGKPAGAFSAYLSKYLNNVTNGQIMDGLDNFYADYQNRRIRVTGAVWLITNGIAGMPKDELDKMLESWRKNAGD